MVSSELLYLLPGPSLALARAVVFCQLSAGLPDASSGPSDGNVDHGFAEPPERLE